MNWRKLLPIGVLLAAVSLPAGGWAGTNATPENCAAVGSVVVHCYRCRPEPDRAYLGKVSVLTGYEEAGGRGYCVEANEAKSACSRVFGISSGNVGFYTKYSIGWGSRDEIYDEPCVNAVGKP